MSVVHEFGWRVIGVGAAMTLLCALSVGADAPPPAAVDKAAVSSRTVLVDEAPTRMDYLVLATVASTGSIGLTRSIGR